MTNLFALVPKWPKRAPTVGVLAAAITLLVSLGAAPALASKSGMTLDDLVNGGMTFAANNGKLTFSNFQVSISDTSANLADYTVKQRSNGFKLFGQRTDQSAKFLDITLSYDVAATKKSHVITAAGLASSKWNKHSNHEAGLQVLTGGGGKVVDGVRGTSSKRMKNKYWSFSDTVKSGRVVESVRISKFSKGGKWNLRRRFKTQKGSASTITPVPEPSTALLLGLGLIGVAKFARRS
jgi:hypothetical protein